jgi:branched-chain amino acid transport system permease protein
VLVLQVVIYGIILGGVYAVMAYGLGLVYGVMRIVNLAHGAVLMLAAYGAFVLHTRWRIDPLLSVFVIVPLAYCAGALLFRHVVSPVASGGTLDSAQPDPMPPMLLLFGVGLCARNLAYLVWTGDDRTIALSYGLSTIDLGVPVPTTRVVVLAIALATTAALFLVFRYTHFGRSVRAVARDPVAAELVGISVARVSARAFGAGTALGALGGVLLATLYVINPEFGGAFLLKSFCIIVLGGMDSMPGILAGALTLGVAETAAGVYGGAAWQDLVSFILLVLMLVARPGGLPSLVKS